MNFEWLVKTGPRLKWSNICFWININDHILVHLKIDGKSQKMKELFLKVSCKHFEKSRSYSHNHLFVFLIMLSPTQQLHEWQMLDQMIREKVKNHRLPLCLIIKSILTGVIYWLQILQGGLNSRQIAFNLLVFSTV